MNVVGHGRVSSTVGEKLWPLSRGEKFVLWEDGSRLTALDVHSKGGFMVGSTSKKLGVQNNCMIRE